jgi:hypothetical protein
VKLDVHDGAIVWQADVKKSSSRSEAPMWGFSASPLVVNDLVIVHAGRKSDKGVLDYSWPHGGYRALQAQIIDGDKV